MLPLYAYATAYPHVFDLENCLIGYKNSAEYTKDYHLINIHNYKRKPWEYVFRYIQDIIMVMCKKRPNAV